MRPIQCMHAITALVAVLLSSATWVIAGEIKGTVKLLGGRGIEYAIVYVERIEGKDFLPSPKNAIVDQVRMTFVPHVLPIIAGTTVDFPNSDSTRHNVFSPSATKRFNLGTYPAGVTKKVIFEKTGIVALLCNVHPEMSAFILVLQNPYYMMVSKNGTFTLSEVPSGKHTLVIWHPKFKSKKTEVHVPSQGSVNVDFYLDE